MATHTTLTPLGISDDQQIANTIQNTAPGGTIQFEPGRYNLTQPIVIPKDSYIKFVGSKFAKGYQGGVMFSAASAMESMFVYEGANSPATNAGLAHDIHFEGITFLGNLRTTNIFKLINVDTVRFYDCRLVGATNSIATEWASTVDPIGDTMPGGLIIDHCIISANSGIGIDLQRQTQCWITNSWYSGTSVQAWIRYLGSNKIHMMNCEFNTAAVGLLLQDLPTGATHDITAVGCVFAMGGNNLAWKDERTHTLSNRVVLQGNTLTPGVKYASLKGINNLMANAGGVLQE